MKAKGLMRPRGSYVTLVGDVANASSITVGAVLGGLGAVLARNAASLAGGPKYALFLKSSGDGDKLSVLRSWLEEGKVLR